MCPFCLPNWRTERRSFQLSLPLLGIGTTLPYTFKRYSGSSVVPTMTGMTPCPQICAHPHILQSLFPKLNGSKLFCPWFFPLDVPGSSFRGILVSRCLAGACSHTHGSSSHRVGVACPWARAVELLPLLLLKLNGCAGCLYFCTRARVSPRAPHCVLSDLELSFARVLGKHGIAA